MSKSVYTHAILQGKISCIRAVQRSHYYPWLRESQSQLFSLARAQVTGAHTVTIQIKMKLDWGRKETRTGMAADGSDQKTLIVYVKLQFLGPVIINFTFEENHYLGSLDRNEENRKMLQIVKP